jgi:hypothetical protein
VSADQRVEILVAVISVFGTALLAVCGFGLRLLWSLANELAGQRAEVAAMRVTIAANTKATDRLSRRMLELTERVTRLEAPPRHR